MSAAGPAPRGIAARLAWTAMLAALPVIVFAVVNFVHFRHFRVRVVGYDALLDVAIAAALTLLAYLALLRRRAATNGLESLLALLAGTLGAMLFAIVVPTVVDRSLSVWILEKLQQRGGAIRESAFEQVLMREYFPEHRLVDIRLTEQLNSGTITIENGCVRLTPRGERVAHWSRLYRQTMLPRHREIMGRFSDDLTDPFRRSAPPPDYRCD